MNLKHGEIALSTKFKNSSDNITSVLEAHTNIRISHYTHTYDLLKINCWNHGNGWVMFHYWEKKNMLICIRNVEYILELKETLKLRGNNTFPLVIP